eukprot:m.348213 g.348213  ORF g.348213 m.348213 type:complete len:478 (-) comp27934_c3_seq1:55-1488(-)
MGCGGSKRVAAATRTRTRPPDPPSNPPTPKSVRSPLEDAARDRELELEQLDAIKEDEAKNYDEVRAVVFRSRLGEMYGFGMGLTSTGTVMVTDLMLGGLADGQLQVGDRVHSVNGEALRSPKTFEDLVKAANESMTCMLVCTRLKGLEHPEPMGDSSPSSSTLSLDTSRKSFDEGFVGLGSTAAAASPPVSRAVSVHTILPNVQIVKRRATIGRTSMVKPPKFDTIVEERQDLSEPPPIDQEFTVALRRESMDQTFGFSVVQYSDKRWVVSRIASNITNWGLLQVGDELLKVGGRATLEMEHSILTGLIEKATNLELDVRRTPRAIVRGSTRRTRRGSVSLFLDQTNLLDTLADLGTQGVANGEDVATRKGDTRKGLAPSLPVEESLTAQTWPGPPQPRPPPSATLFDADGRPPAVTTLNIRGPVAPRRSTSPLQNSVTASSLGGSTPDSSPRRSPSPAPSLTQALAGIVIRNSTSF